MSDRPPATVAPPKPSRRRFAPRIRTLMLLVLACAGGLWGWQEVKRQRAVWALTGLLPAGVRIGPESADDRTDPKDPRRNALYLAVERVKRVKAEGYAVSSLRRALRDRPTVNPISGPEAMRAYLCAESAIPALIWLGPGARSAAPELIATLRDPRAPIALQFEAAHALGVLGGDDPETVPALVEALARREPVGSQAGRYVSDGGIVAQNAAIALGRLGPRAKAAVPRLIEAVGSDIRNLRVSAIQALGRIGPDARAAVPVLEAILDEPEKNPDPFLVPVRAMAAMALGGIAEGRPGTIAALETMKDSDPDPSAQYHASRAVDRIRARPSAATTADGPEGR